MTVLFAEQCSILFQNGSYGNQEQFFKYTT